MSPAENVCQRPIPVVTVLTILPQMPVVGSATEQKSVGSIRQWVVGAKNVADA